ncbi:hypothetical protein T4B_1869 [Trichinella pseudospiralis]|uniref:Uncharacterized protein n=2 Tax=Trichinella pseudospiralis TaxID=6337 RepID=A0A0V1GGF9_TRIPS|nr:hypothetical protein T4D_14532 [Trichinella pseudospiralis]KRY95568.1 hypothetical protein T4B_1869 [Trichinella pseudospiralis]KRY96851.1 hypothetical protein T4C_6092 [Trichinella pseudospiralis]
MHKKLNITKIQVFTYVDRCSDESEKLISRMKNSHDIKLNTSYA